MAWSPHPQPQDTLKTCQEMGKVVQLCQKPLSTLYSTAEQNYKGATKLVNVCDYHISGTKDTRRVEEVYNL